jgi:hypothetical protein
MRIRIKPARAAFCAVVLAALSFGTTQAFARAYPISEGEYCTSGADFYSCWQGCVERYGEGTQATCARQFGSPFPVCQCLP